MFGKVLERNSKCSKKKTPSEVVTVYLSDLTLFNQASGKTTAIKTICVLTYQEVRHDSPDCPTVFINLCFQSLH